MPVVATRIDRVELDAEREITTGSAEVLGVIVGNNSGSTQVVNVQNAAGTNKLTIVVGDGTSEDFNVSWIADGGVKFASVASDVFATIAWRPDA